MTPHDWRLFCLGEFDWSTFLKPIIMIYALDIKLTGLYRCSKCQEKGYVHEIGTAIKVSKNWTGDCDEVILQSVHGS